MDRRTFLKLPLLAASPAFLLNNETVVSHTVKASNVITGNDTFMDLCATFNSKFAQPFVGDVVAEVYALPADCAVQPQNLVAVLMWAGNDKKVCVTGMVIPPSPFSLAIKNVSGQTVSIVEDLKIRTYSVEADEYGRMRYQIKPFETIKERGDDPLQQEEGREPVKERGDE